MHVSVFILPPAEQAVANFDRAALRPTHQGHLTKCDGSLQKLISSQAQARATTLDLRFQEGIPRLRVGQYQSYLWATARNAGSISGRNVTDSAIRCPSMRGRSPSDPYVLTET
jgi:hypothetical protein